MAHHLVQPASGMPYVTFDNPTEPLRLITNYAGEEDEDWFYAIAYRGSKDWRIRVLDDEGRNLGFV